MKKEQEKKVKRKTETGEDREKQMPTGQRWKASGWEAQTQSSLKTDGFLWAERQYKARDIQWHWSFLWGRRIVKETDTITTTTTKTKGNVEQKLKGNGSMEDFLFLLSKRWNRKEEEKKILRRIHVAWPLNTWLRGIYRVFFYVQSFI